MEKGFALITGSSKGIGKELAISLAKRNYNLLLVSRSVSELETTKSEIQNRYKVTINCKAIDLSDIDSAKNLFEWCVQNNYRVEILINNAGYGLFGYFEKMSIEDQQNMIRLNVNSLVALTWYFIPHLKQNKQSYIMNVASSAAYQAVPTLSVYAATKAFVVLFSRGLRMELRKSSVSVSCLSPGATASNFTNRAGMQAMQAMADKMNMDANVVAEIGINGLLSKKAEIIPGFVNIFSIKMINFLPKSLIEGIAANLYLKKLEKT